MRKRDYQHKKLKRRRIFLTLAYLLPVSLFLMLLFKLNHLNQQSNSGKCAIQQPLPLKNNIPQSLTGILRKNQADCFNFYAAYGQSLILKTNTKITVLTPSQRVFNLQGSSQNILEDTGNYSIVIETKQDVTNYQIELSLVGQNIATQPSLKYLDPLSYNTQAGVLPLQFTYNVVTPPPFKKNQRLQEIVDSIVNRVETRGLPVERFSVSLVDLSQSECCAYAFYLDQERRYSASIAKLFWMVALFGQYQAGIIPEGTVLYKKLSKMIKDSDNNAASFILDKITRTESGTDLPSDELEKWIAKRYSINQIFEQAGYQNINLSQKPFPITDLKLDTPTGRDKQIRGEQILPIRNYITTYNVARLMFEISTEQSISKRYSRQMKSLLERDLHPEAWKNKEFNAIEGFLGEYLPANAYFASKMGWTYGNRNDAAIIASPDGKAHYILVVFGDDPSFYKDKTIYPEISRMVYERMTNKNSF